MKTKTFCAWRVCGVVLSCLCGLFATNGQADSTIALPKATIDGGEPGWRVLEEKGGPFPSGIEVQVLDHGYKEQYEKRSKKKADWFTTNGDVFPVGSSTMTPFAPTSPDGRRSFPSKNLSKGFGEWNHYYVRCINGEIRLWVNGEEVSGGNNIEPASGYLCLESEGAPIDFKEIRVR